MRTAPKYAATLAALALTTTLTACGDDEAGRNTSSPASPSDVSTSASPSTPAPVSSASTSATAEPSQASDQGLVPVYFVGDTGAGPRLFREFLHGASDQPSRVFEALNLAVTGSSVDADYESGWPAGTKLASVEPVHPQGSPEEIESLVVGLEGPDLTQRPAGMSAEAARIALQQLVYTAQAATQQRLSVRFQVDGKPVSTLLGVLVRKPVTNADPMQVQGSVWVIDPQDGATVGSPFTVTGRGAFFEANVSWQLLQDGKVVKSGHATAEEGNTLSPYSFKVSAKPGDYVLRVYDADMSGGEGGPEAEDTKRITVR